jgi:hypothetical protein
VVSKTEGRARRLDPATDTDGCQGRGIGTADAVVVRVMLLLMLVWLVMVLLLLLLLLVVVVVVKVVSAVNGLLGWSWRPIGVSLEADVHPGRRHHGGGVKAGKHNAVRLKIENVETLIPTKKQRNQETSFLLPILKMTVISDI